MQVIYGQSLNLYSPPARTQFSQPLEQDPLAVHDFGYSQMKSHYVNSSGVSLLP